MGRPPLGAKAKTEFVFVRVTKAELGILKAEAKREGLSMPALLMRPWRQKQGE